MFYKSKAMKIILLLHVALLGQVFLANGHQRFVRSSNHVQQVSQVAKQQLNAISQFKNGWDARNGANATIEEFWRAVEHCDFISPTACECGVETTADCSSSADSCPLVEPTCSATTNSMYRTYDGSCNNQIDGQHAWGMANTAQARILDPQYEDGVSAPRLTGDSGAVLPNARTVSKTLNNIFLHVPSSLSYLVMQYGQYLDHDITHTDAAENIDAQGEEVPIQCQCGQDIDECNNIEIPRFDKMRFSQSCMTVTRSAAWPQPRCTNGPRQQVNSITSWIDCSHVYGSSKPMADRLRDSDTTRGKMATTSHPTNSTWKPLLPHLNSNENSKQCVPGVNFPCFLAGDDRRNAQPGLVAMHTIWVRLHNYVEGNLHALNPGWDGEKLYQESRRIVIAITQHVTYNEYLASILGQAKIDEQNVYFNGANLGVDTDSSVYSNVYNSSVKANIASVFSTAAYRFGHSEINDYLKFLRTFNQPGDIDCNARNIRADQKPSYCVRLRETFDNPSTIYESPAGMDFPGVDSVLKGMMTDRAETADTWYSEEINDYLFTPEPKNSRVFGFDLLALNIQRGRDHGLPSYMKFREHYGLSTSNSWYAKPVDMRYQEWFKLRAIYASPEDIDVYAGGVIALHTGDSKVGQLFTEIIAEQFTKLKLGDRFWYENGGLDSSFTLDQLIEIRKMTLGWIFCVTMDDPGSLPQFVFQPIIDDSNPLLPCPGDIPDGSTQHTHPQIDFTKWIDPTAAT